MYIHVKLVFGGSAWAEVIDWGNDEPDRGELEFDNQKRLPFLVLIEGRFFQRGAGYYFPV